MRHVFIGSILFFLGFFGVFAFRFVQVQNSPPFVPQPSSFTLEPPSATITATLSQSSGVVQQFTREARDYQEATPSGSIRQGESIATKNGAATITISNPGTVTLGSNAEIRFVNLLPDSLMFLHKAGTIDYKTNTSIRALRALIELTGDATISVDEPKVKILVTRGSAKLALVDTQNNTTIWNVEEGQMAQINSETRTVVLRK